MGMQRAAVLIGVEKTGTLPQLQAVQSGVETVRAWAASQPGIGDRVVLLTDAGGAAVTAGDIKKAIKAFVDRTTVTQLIVYFAGHGVNVRYNEYWLLSGAPEDASEAVNVASSVALARYCGIPHIVLISDACRTAAESIQAQNVEGVSIFPNGGPGDAPGRVDVFYAALAGKPALEVKDPAAAAAGFQAVYTNALVEGLGGGWPKLVEREERTGSPAVGRVRAWPLHRYLEAEVPARLRRLGVALGVSQTPDAVITSEPEAWLAEIKIRSTRGLESVVRRAPAAEPPRIPPPTLGSVSQRALRAALKGDAVPPEVLSSATELAGGTLLHDALTQPAPALGHFETQCGFKVSGIAVVEAVSTGARLELLSGAEGLVRTSLISAAPAASVLLVFADGRGTLLPAISGFIAGLTYENGELASVAYEPSDNTARWSEFQAQLPELRELRRVVSSAARMGTFRLERKEDAATLVDRLRTVKCQDPSMAVYAAYGLHELHQREEVVSMEHVLRSMLQMSLFDVAMLAQRPVQEGEAPRTLPADVFPAFPLLSQGWAFLKAYGVTLPAGLERLARNLTESLWTLLDGDGVVAVRNALNSGEIH